MFYYNFVNLCNQIGKSPSAAAEEMGFQRSVVTRWSKGTLPRQATLQKIADYFGVSLFDLTGTKEKPATVAGDELSEKDVQLANWFRSLSAEKQRALLNLGDAPKELLDALEN